MPIFDPTRCKVRPINYRTVQIVLAEAHYIGTPGATSVALGLYVDDVIAGVITFGTVPKNNASAICGAKHGSRVMELTRLALYDWPPKNSESWFISRAFAWLRENRPDIAIIVSYADGSVGHVGTIYQATNFIYTGASTNDYVYQCDNGDVLHPRTTGRMRGDLPAGHWRPAAAKHRYVTFVGPMTKTLRRSMQWEPLPYPKQLQERVIAA